MPLWGKPIVAGLRLVYTAVNAETAAQALDELEEQWGNRYSGVIRIWRQAWEEFIPFLRLFRRMDALHRGFCRSRGGNPPELEN